MQMPQAPIKAVLLSDLVQERLLSDIVTGRYAPGERLNLDEIADECGVSRMPIREALQALSTIGFVAVARNARTIVAEWSAEDMRERVAVIGRLVTFLAGASEVIAPVEQRTLRASVGSDYEVYLELVSQIVAARLPRLAEYVERAMIAPLRLFLHADVLASHGLGAPLRRDIRSRVIADALDAFADDDRSRVVDALTRYADELAVALTLPGTANGSSLGSASLHTVR